MEFLVSVAFVVAGTVWMCILFAALFGKALLSLLPKRFTRLRWPHNGVEADAVVLRIENTGILINKKPQVRLQMQVKPCKGKNFVIEIDTVSPPVTRTGSVIRVKYNPRNTRELLFLPAA